MIITEIRQIIWLLGRQNYLAGPKKKKVQNHDLGFKLGHKSFKLKAVISRNIEKGGKDKTNRDFDEQRIRNFYLEELDKL